MMACSSLFAFSQTAYNFNSLQPVYQTAGQTIPAYRVGLPTNLFAPNTLFGDCTYATATTFVCKVPLAPSHGGRRRLAGQQQAL